MRMIDLTPLQPLVDPEATRNILRSAPQPLPDKLIAGFLGTMQFIVSLDANGHCEASFATPHGRPTSAQQEAFWRRWGVRPPEQKPTVIFRGRGLHWVVQQGVHHA